MRSAKLCGLETVALDKKIGGTSDDQNDKMRKPMLEVLGLEHQRKRTPEKVLHGGRVLCVCVCVCMHSMFCV